MPRTARLDAPGVFHHVMIGGLNAEKYSEIKRIGKLSGKEGAEEETLVAIKEEGLGTESREEEPFSSPVTFDSDDLIDTTDFFPYE